MRVPLDRTQEAGESADIWSSFFFQTKFAYQRETILLKFLKNLSGLLSWLC